jgi:hypothetical protein
MLFRRINRIFLYREVEYWYTLYCYWPNNDERQSITMKHLRMVTKTAPGPAYIAPGQILGFFTSLFTVLAIVIPILLPLLPEKDNNGNAE